MKFNFGFFKSLAVGSLLATSVFADTELTVYTAVEAEDLSRYAAKFNESHPDIKTVSYTHLTLPTILRV